MNLGYAVARHAITHPDSVAYFGPDEMSYRELDERTNQIASWLIQRGVQIGDRVAVFVPNGRSVVEILVACAKAGAVYVGLNFRLDHGELTQILTNCTPRLMLGASEFDSVLERLCDEHSIARVRVDGPDAYGGSLTEQPTCMPEVAALVRSTDDACIVYSSGTTGVPKGILFDHSAVLNHALVTALEFDIDRDTRYLVQLPHNSSLNITIAPCLVRGAALGFEDSRGFDPDTFGRRVQSDQVSHSFLVPTMLYRLLEHISSDDLLSSLKVLGYGSSSIPADRVRQLVARFGPIFIQLYGMAEIASIGTLLRRDDHAAAIAGKDELFSSAGRPSMGVAVRVVDPATGDDVAVGERGEVLFAGPHLMRGYNRDPERTNESVRDGWMHSGDIGVFDEDGYLYIVDRIKDLIIHGGHNIAPKEIEEVLYDHEAVLEVAVVGVPDPEWGESVYAAVVLKEGHEVSADGLREWCRSRNLSSIKVPSRIVIVEELPKSAVGKFDKKRIAEQVTRR